MAENQKDQNQTQGGQRQDQGTARQPGGQQGDNFATQADGERTQGRGSEDDRNRQGAPRDKEQQGTEFNPGQNKPGQGGH